MTNGQYLYLWEFFVAPEHRDTFEQTYGRSGEWIRLFRRAPGYIGTELHRDQNRTERYITIDYWESQSALETFRRVFASEIAALDAKCGEWTTGEKEIGHFCRIV